MNCIWILLLLLCVGNRCDDTNDDDHGCNNGRDNNGYGGRGRRGGNDDNGDCGCRGDNDDNGYGGRGCRDDNDDNGYGGRGRRGDNDDNGYGGRGRRSDNDDYDDRRDRRGRGNRNRGDVEGDFIPPRRRRPFDDQDDQCPCTREYDYYQAEAREQSDGEDEETKPKDA